MKSNVCKVCGTLGGGGTKDCVNKLRHDLLIRSKHHLTRMQERSYLYKIANNFDTGHDAMKKVLSTKVSSMLKEKNKAPKSLFFKRKRYA